MTEDSREIANIADTTYIHTYVDPTVTYYYRVGAENPWAEGPLSGEVSVMPLPPPPEEAPGSVAATPGDTQVEVTWASVADVDGYHLYWGTAGEALGNLVDDAESPYAHAGLTNGTEYHYRVAAYNAGGEGPLSVEVSAVPQVPAPGAPRNLTAVAGDGRVTLTWTEPDTSDGSDVSSYTVYWDTESPVDTNSPAVTGVPGSPYVHASRANGTTYYYRVSAMNPGGESALSLEVSATPQPPAPSTPGFLEAEAGSREVRLTWASMSGAEAYDLFWDTEPDVTMSDSNIADIASTEFTHTGLTNGTTYYYRVRARNGGGQSTLSQEASAKAQFQTEMQERITVSEGKPHDYLGDSVAVSGDTMVAGAPYVDAVDDEGAAYVFDRTDAGWEMTHRLMVSGAEVNSRFGDSVAISGDYVVVGGHLAGAVSVFERNGTEWKEVKLTAGSSSSFGDSVAVSGDYLLVGAYGENAAFVFERTEAQWQEVKRLVSSDLESGDRFGFSVAIDGLDIVVGVDQEDSAGSNAGAAYSFYRSASGWIQGDKIMASDGEAGDHFGNAVAISGNYLVVGAHWEDTGGDHAGAAYVFERSGAEWHEKSVLKASNAHSTAEFGGSVAISDGYVVVGAGRETFGGYTSGAAYVFERIASGWQEVDRLTASDAPSLSRSGFGRSVAISGTYVVVGARTDYAAGGAAGAVYVF